MSTKDNWDDESSDEEELPTDPILKEGGLLRFNLDTVNAVESEAPIECDEVEIAENEEPLIQEEYPPEEEWEGEDPIDDEYDDDYDDEIDKKLGRYVSCR